jgi:hypothetical protein
VPENSIMRPDYEEEWAIEDARARRVKQESRMTILVALLTGLAVVVFALVLFHLPKILLLPPHD